MNYILSYFFALMMIFYPAEDEKNCLSGGTGLQFSSSVFNARIFSDVPKTNFSDLPYYATAQTFSQFFDAPAWGISIAVPPPSKKFPHNFKLAAGNLTYSGSLSRLKSPPPSTIASPLKSTFTFSPGLRASLPSSSNSASSKSANISYKTAINTGLSSVSELTAEAALFEDKAFYASSSFSIPFSQSVKFKTALTGGRFYLENNSTTLWKAGGGFTPGWFYAGVWENSFQSPLVKINLSSGLHETPWGPPAFWIKCETRFAISHFLLNTSFFAVPTEKTTPSASVLIGSDSSVCRTIAQGAVNPQIAAGNFKFGVCALAYYKTTSTKTPVDLLSGKLSFGASFDKGIFFCRAQADAANILLYGEPPTLSSAPQKSYSASFDSRISSRPCRLYFSCGISHYPPVSENSVPKQVYSADISASPGRKRIATATAGLDMTIKDNERYSTSADAGITIRLATKTLRCTIKCAVQSRF